MLNVEEKVKVITKIQMGWGVADVCREFGPENSTIQTIWRNRTKIISAFEVNGSKVKLFRKPGRSDVKALLNWFKQDGSDNVPVRGPHLMRTFVLHIPKF